jgi:hypothetical protein
LREAGTALEAIQAQAGHASIESTRIYLHLANDWLAGEYRRAFEAIDGQGSGGAPMMTAISARSAEIETYGARVLASPRIGRLLADAAARSQGQAKPMRRWCGGGGRRRKHNNPATLWLAVETLGLPHEAARLSHARSIVLVR